MNREEILEVLRSCLLAIDNENLDGIISKGIEPTLAKYGLQIYSYLQRKNLEEEKP